MTQRRVDKDKRERADRESKLSIAAERSEREAKTARLRAQRKALAATAPPASGSRVAVGPKKKLVRKVIEIE